MNNFFLKIDASKLTLDNLKNYQLPIPVCNDEASNIFFHTEEEYCDYLNEIEKAGTKFLAEYWIFKTPELIAKSRYIVKVLTILQDERAKNYLQL